MGSQGAHDPSYFFFVDHISSLENVCSCQWQFIKAKRSLPVVVDDLVCHKDLLSAS